MKKVTQIICFYNEEKYLEKAILSILNQTYKNIELIIINDGSTDLSEKIVQGIQDERLIYISNNKNHGLAWCRNQGLNLATGEYVGFVDADDIAEINKIEKQVSFLEKNKDILAVSGNYDYIDRDGKHLNLQNKDIPTDNLSVRTKMLFGNCVAGPCALFRREIINKNNIRHDIHMITSQDYFFWLECLKFGKICNIDDILFHYRINHGSKSNINKAKDEQAYNHTLKKIISYAWSSRGYDLSEDEIDFIYIFLYKQNKRITIKLFKFCNNLLSKIDEQSRRMNLDEKQMVHKEYIDLCKKNNYIFGICLVIYRLLRRI